MPIDTDATAPLRTFKVCVYSVDSGTGEVLTEHILSKHEAHAYEVDEHGALILFQYVEDEDTGELAANYVATYDHDRWGAVIDLGAVPADA